MDERYKSSPADDALVSDRSADVVDRLAAMDRIAFDEIDRLEPAFAEQLHDPEDEIRSKAIEVLVGRWWREAYVEQALKMLRSERDPMVRRTAAGALGGFVHRPRHFPKAEPAPRDLAFGGLLQAFLDDPAWTVQEAAYVELHRFLRGAAPFLPEYYQRDTDTDWELLAPHVPPERIPSLPPRPPRVSSDADIDVLRDDTADPEDRVAAIERLAADRRYEVGWYLERLRYNDSALLRGRVLLELIRTWRYENYLTVKEMLESDPGWEARMAAAEAVPYLLQGLPGHRALFRQTLVDALIREQDERVEAAIRQSIDQIDDPAFPPLQIGIQ